MAASRSISLTLLKSHSRSWTSPTIVGLGLVKTGAAVEIPFGMRSVTDGVFVADEKQAAILGGILAELSTLAEALKPMR